VPQGVVAWFDQQSEMTIRSLWEALAEIGVPSPGFDGTATARPHVTFFYGDTLAIEPTVAALSALPALGDLPVRLGSVGVFPRSVLHLPVVPSVDLLHRHRRVSDAAGQWVKGGHASYGPDRWSPHVTLASKVPTGLLGAAVEMCASRLPIVAALTSGGIEDGTTGEAWVVSSLP